MNSQSNCLGRKPKRSSYAAPGPEFLLLKSEPIVQDYTPGLYLALSYQSRFLARRHVRRNIRRLRGD